MTMTMVSRMKMAIGIVVRFSIRHMYIYFDFFFFFFPLWPYFEKYTHFAFLLVAVAAALFFFVCSLHTSHFVWLDVNHSFVFFFYSMHTTNSIIMNVNRIGFFDIDPFIETFQMEINVNILVSFFLFLYFVYDPAQSEMRFDLISGIIVSCLFFWRKMFMKNWEFIFLLKSCDRIDWMNDF